MHQALFVCISYLVLPQVGACHSNVQFPIMLLCMCKYWHDLMCLQLTIEPNLHDFSPNPSWTSHTLSQDPNSRPCNLVTHQLINFLTSYNSNTCTITYSPNLHDYTPNPSWMYLIPCLDPSCPACHNNVQFPIMLLCMCKYWHDLMCLQLIIEPNLHDCSPNPSWTSHTLS